MRYAVLALILNAVATPSALYAQPQKPPPLADVKQYRIGFGSYNPEDGQGRYKVGMWTPVYVKIKAGLNGIRPKGKDEVPFIQVDTNDAEDVGTIFRSPFGMEPNDERYVLSYGRPGKFSDIKMTVRIGDLTVPMPPFGTAGSLELNTHLYVTLGEKIPDLQSALFAMSPMQQQQFNNQFGNQQGQRTSWPRFAGHETEVSLLPEYWWGYQSVDLLFLSTRDKDFLLNLAKDNDASRARLRAIAQWVRRGGRMVIPVQSRNADVLAQLLQSTVWQPALPVVPPREGTFEVQRLGKLEAFAGGVPGKPFVGGARDPLKLAVLAPAKIPPGAWDVLVRADDTRDSKPLIARMPYGLGSITYLALPLDDAPFTGWTGKVEFLKALVKQLGPRVPTNMQQHEQHQQQSTDVASQLQRSLDQFDVRVIPFGYVALFIVLYIIIVGPLDFILLKYVFKRLEWTWFTFPTVVIAVSIAAYYTAYAIKGHDLKINKVDIVDIDLRTNVDGKGQTKKASIYGQSFFTILSPRIQNYTVGVEPNPAFWGQTAEETLSADMLTWLGRADDQFGGMGARGGSQGFFRKPYRYNDDASGLRDVPIPVWTTKSFQASWEVQSQAPPLEADLRYFNKLVAGKDLRIVGKLKSKLPIDLDNAWLIYLDQAFEITGGLPKGSEQEVAFEAHHKKSISEWGQAAADGNRIQTAGGQYNPSSIIRQILFNERTDQAATSRNHTLRPLDLSWRLQDESTVRDPQGLREAILVARVKFAVGSAETMLASVSDPLPTNLWLGALPGETAQRPELAGILAQDTFVRIIIPVRPNP